MRHTAASIGVALLIAAVASCGGGNDEAQPTASPAGDRFVIELDDFYIEPKTIEVKVGQTLEVTAFTEGQQTHTFTIDELGIDRTFPTGSTQEFSLTPTEAGEFKVYCRFHEGQGMTATMVVDE